MPPQSWPDAFDGAVRRANYGTLTASCEMNGGRVKRGVAVGRAALRCVDYSPSWLTTDSAISVSVSSVVFSSCSVWSSSRTARSWPSSAAHVFKVP